MFLTLCHGKRSCIINYACIINVIYARNEIFGHLLEFGTSGGFDIAYNDSKKCFLTVGYGIRSCTINLVCINSLIYANREPKQVFAKCQMASCIDIVYKLKPGIVKAEYHQLAQNSNFFTLAGLERLKLHSATKFIFCTI